MAYTVPSITGWGMMLLLVAIIAYPFLLRAGLLGAVQPFLRRMPFHYWMAYSLALLLFIHLWVSMTGMLALAINTLGLYLATVGVFVEKLEREESNEMETAKQQPSFALLRPGGQRQPLAYDPKGFFVITLDRDAGEIVLRHYLPDNSPAHEMRGHTTEPMLLGLLREELVSQLSHVGYLGGELAKAEAALRLHLRYEQDQPLRSLP